MFILPFVVTISEHDVKNVNAFSQLSSNYLLFCRLCIGTILLPFNT